MKNGAIAAFKVEEKRRRTQLTPAWISRDMNQAEPPVIANGVIFAYGSGENTAQAFPDVGLDFRMRARIPKSTHAVLYALDAQTGKELWSSGKQITTWNHWSGLSVGQRPGVYQHLRRNAVLLRISQMKYFALVLLGVAGCLSAQEPTREELEREITAQQRLLNDWAGLTRYGSENTELKLPANENRVVFIGRRDHGKLGEGEAKFFPVSRT